MSREGPDQFPMSAMSKPLRRLRARPGRTAGPGLWAGRLLPLWLCLGWLWVASPVAAQDEAAPSATEATGPYRNLAVNHTSTFHLTREGNAVYATFQTDRSPVQFLARDQPEVLFTVPEGFRPAVDVTWEVSAEPVLPDGTPHPDRRVFRMQVDTAGHVRYVDDAGVDGVGHLRYHTMLAWPRAGSEPQVCTRPRYIREAILAAVQALEDAAVPCTQVDWSHLAGIRTLSVSIHIDPDLARHALLGLTNLTTLQLRSWSVIGVTVPAELLVHTPRLKRLDVDDSSFTLPADLLLYTPLLADLSLGNNPHRELDLPGDLLVHTPHLETLHLEGRHPAAGLVQLMAHVPRLTRLTVMPSTPLPETFLAAVPHLTHLTIKEGFEPCATPQLLAPVPHLRHVAVRMPAEAEPLACLARALRRYAPALDQLEVDLKELHGLTVEILPRLPQLTHLTLDVHDITSLPMHLLAQAPELTRLTIQGGADLTLPASFFAHTPRLTDLSLQVSRLNDLPPDLLAPVPDLRRLQLVTRDATTLPEWFLDQVTEMRMAVGQLTDLPADFLMHAPHLEVLYLDVRSQKSFPEHFLTYAPRLVELHLDAPSLRALPPSFLAHAPRLEVFHLDTGYSWRFKDGGDTPSVLRSFPKNFLSHTPQLVELHLRVPALGALPSSFLGHAPRLETLELIGTHDYYGEDELPIRSLPPNFLIHAPRLRHLDLGALGYVEAFPPGFLAHAPQLRYLNLDATDAASLPPEFLTRHPRLEMVRLQAKHVPVLPPGFLSQSPNLIDLRLGLQQVDALPEGFLAETSRLWNLEIDVDGVESLPAGFLAEVPYLTNLQLRALNLTAWPADFLAHAPRLRTLSLAMPRLEPTLTPGHRLWDTLQTASSRVKVIRSDPFYFMDYIPIGECWGPSVQLGSILTVEGREQGYNGHTLLRVRHWQDHELFAIPLQPMCPFLIDARHTTPTLEICDTFRAPETCIPYRDRDLYKSYRWNFVEQ